MSLFYMHYNCYPGAIVMRKDTGAIYRVRGNVSLWDMTAVLDPFDPDAPDQHKEGASGTLAVPANMFYRFLILDEGKPRAPF